MRLGKWPSWTGAPSIAWLFGLTVILPSLVLAGLAYRALESDRRLAEQAWRERMQTPLRNVYTVLEQRMSDIRDRARLIAEGRPLDTSPGQGSVEAILSPALEVCPAAAVAWLPDGRAPAPRSPPDALQDAELSEFRAADPHSAAIVYRALLRTTPEKWHGWLYLRLGRVHARRGATSESRAALENAADLPDSPDGIPSRLAARFELASNDPEAATRLYRDLVAGTWLLEKSSYLFYEMRLRQWSGGGRVPAETAEREERRQSVSRLLERAAQGQSGRLTDRSVSAMVTLASGGRQAAIVTTDRQWAEWAARTSPAGVSDAIVRAGPKPPDRSGLVVSQSLAALGTPWWIWCEPRDAGAVRRANESRSRLSFAILLLVGGVLAFGSLATMLLVRRELRIARFQSDFAATVSHEFRSPITGIRQLSEMLLAGRSADDETRRRQYYQMICRESARLARLVDSVLDFSRAGRAGYRFEKIETGEWLRGLACIAEQRRAVNADLPDGLPAIEGDRDALSSAVLNLLDNAVKYSPEEAPVALLARCEGGWVTIGVRDQGPGIPVEEQRRIFDRYYRGEPAPGRRGQGLGLGLALVKRIADAHGARLRLDSAPGEGSTFYLSIRTAV